MRDKRPVDELSIEELERILAIRKREERMQRLKRMERSGRLIEENASSQVPAVVPQSIPAVLSPSDAVPAPILKPAAKSTVFSAKTANPRFEDDDEQVQYPVKTSPDGDRFWKRFVNSSLLLVEIAAVFALVYLGYSMFAAISTLERETASAQALADEQRRAGIPTIAPTPQLSLAQVVLPSGHTPPTSAGGAQFNFAEIPANLLPMVQNQLLQPVINRPPPTDETPLRLVIDKLDVDQTIVPGDDWEALRLGIGLHLNGATPDMDIANVVMSAHNDIYGEYFRYLDQLEAGDTFQVQTRTKIYTYVVREWEIVEPTDVQVLASRGSATATLISCYPYQVNTHRIVVFADRVDA